MDKITCPICNSKNNKLIWGGRSEGYKISVVKCFNDGMIFLSPRHSSRIYNNYYTEKVYKNGLIDKII